MPPLAIVIPCLNEADRLDIASFIEFAHHHPNIHFYFVNDGSKDNTLEKLLSIQNETCNTEILNFKYNVGKGEAVRQGMLKASKNPFSYIGYLDADLSTPLIQFYELYDIAHNNNADVVLGSRIKKVDVNIERSFIRHLIGRTIATIIDSRFNLGIYDTQCGAKIFKSEILLKLIEMPFKTKWLFDVEVFLRLFNYAQTLNCIEVPLKQWKSKSNSKITLLSIPTIIRELTVLLTNYKSIKRYTKAE